MAASIISSSTPVRPPHPHPICFRRPATGKTAKLRKPELARWQWRRSATVAEQRASCAGAAMASRRLGRATRTVLQSHVLEWQPLNVELHGNRRKWIMTPTVEFKDAGHARALYLCYRDALLRSFVLDAVSYCVRMKPCCKKGRFPDALKPLEEMRTRETCKTYGACARRLFDEMDLCGVIPDHGAPNVLMGTYMRPRDL